MAYEAVTASEIAVGKFTKPSLWGKIKGNFEYLYGVIGTLGLAAKDLQNGSFEVDSDSDGSPDNWVTSVYAGGTKELMTTTSAHGKNSMKFTHPGGAGNGGGYLQSDYIEVGLLSGEAIQFAVYCTNSATKVRVEINWYSAAKALLSTTVAYESVTNAAFWQQVVLCGIAADASMTARYMKIKLIGGYTDTNQAGDVYFDDVRLIPVPSPISSTVFTFQSYVQPQHIATQAIDIPTEVGDSSGVWTDVAGVGISVPVLASKLIGCLNLRTDQAAYPASARWRIGGNYGTEVVTASESVVQLFATLDLAGYSGGQTLYLQVKGGGSFATATGNSPAALRKVYRTKVRVVDYLANSTYDL